MCNSERKTLETTAGTIGFLGRAYKICIHRFSISLSRFCPSRNGNGKNSGSLVSSTHRLSTEEESMCLSRTRLCLAPILLILVQAEGTTRVSESCPGWFGTGFSHVHGFT